MHAATRRSTRLMSAKGDIECAEAGNDKSSILSRSLTDTSAFATRKDENRFNDDAYDVPGQKSLVSSLMMTLNESKVGRSVSLPMDLSKRKLLRQENECRLISYFGVSRPLWQTRFDAHVSYVDEPEKKLYLGSFDNAEAAARAVDLLQLRLGQQNELNFPIADYIDDLDLLNNHSVEELTNTLVEISQSSQRRTSRFRGVSLSSCGFGFEARYELESTSSATLLRKNSNAT